MFPESGQGARSLQADANIYRDWKYLKDTKRMNSIVCTLFEGHYHHGGAALINSLYANGFRGDFYVGYRGALPPWAKEAKQTTIAGKEVHSFQPAAGFTVRFLPVETKRHLTNYKALFMKELMPLTQTGVFYIDPDIVVKCNWSFFEEWITYGAALVQEIASNSVSPNHPKRARWKKVIAACGKKTERELHRYYNGGFCGVSKENEEFIDTWEEVMTVGIREYGMDDNYFSKAIDQLSMFPVGDQDAINVAAMCCTSPVSDFGPEGMDFIHGGWLMSHAVGKPKPWATEYIRKALKGQKISQPEKQFWNYADGIIKAIPAGTIKRKRSAIKIASFINRFYSRS